MFSQKYLNEEEIFQLLTTIDEGYHEPSDEIFAKCNTLNKPFEKLGVITLPDENDLHAKHNVSCNIPGCNQSFETVFEYESHYNSLHRYLCSNCKKNLPSAHLLDLHISETHDSFFAAQAERKPMYSCYLAECSHKSSNAEERKDHCIREHKFPSNFRFETSNLSSHQIKGKQNKEYSCKMEIEDEKYSENSNEEVKNKANINFFSFGHQRIKCFDSSQNGKSKKGKKKTNNQEEISALEDDQMVKDLLQSLPDQQN